MEKGKISRDEFMREIAQMTQVIVKRQGIRQRHDSGDYHLHTPCPNCGGVVKENYRRFACTKCEFSMSKRRAAASLNRGSGTAAEGPHHRSAAGLPLKMGRPFAAILRIVRDEEIKNFKLEFDFGQNDDSEDSEPVDFSGRPRWARARSAMAACTKWAWRMCANTAWPSRRLATSAAAASSCSRRSCGADGQAAQRRQDRPAARLHLAAHAPSVQGLPGEGRDEDQLRV
jgi:ribosomal protein S27AE